MKDMRLPVPMAKRIFNSALEAVLPPVLVRNCLQRQGDKLHVDGKSYELAQNVRVIGFGKAVSGMCRAVQDILSEHILKGILSVPTGTVDALRKADKSYLLPVNDGKISLREGAANNLPDENSHLTTIKMIEMLQEMSKDDILITLVSGGGSALLCAPVPPVSLQEKLEITSLLANRGASIQELNTIRKRLSVVKGGGVAQIAYPTQIITLILSDIIGDPLDLIASGPTLMDRSTPQDCIDILKKFHLTEHIPNSVETVLKEKFSKSDLESEGGDKYLHVQNVLVGTNAIAVSAAVKEAQNLGYTTFVLSKEVQGEARDVGVFYVKLGIMLANMMCDKLVDSISNHTKIFENFMQNSVRNDWTWKYDMEGMATKLCKVLTDPSTTLRKICIIAAGETTVTVNGNGIGGRNQEMVLSAAAHHFKHRSEMPGEVAFTFLSSGTDGQDGPTDANGAIFNSSNGNLIKTESDLVKAEEALANNDSSSFLVAQEGCVLKTGLTGTNVMDLQIITLDIKYSGGIWKLEGQKIIAKPL